jgi:hypothetical protein
MIVFLDRELRLSLLEAADFKAFRVDVPAGRALAEIARAVEPAVAFEGDEVAWVSETWLRGQRAEAAWQEGLAAMIEKARPHGWIRNDPELAVRAHVKRV